MQIEASDALDLSQETAATLKLYGIDQPVTESYGRRCLIARRLIERGVRFVQLFINSQIWDNHSNIGTDSEGRLRPHRQAGRRLAVRPAAAGPARRDARSLGRRDGPAADRPASRRQGPQQSRPRPQQERHLHLDGRRRRQERLSCTATTDELGFAAVEDRVSVEDWHATILHLLGLSHESLVIERNGLKERLTGVTHPRIVTELLD